MSQVPLPIPRPSDNPLQKPFWSALGRGRLTFQRCGTCGNAFLPAREECPRCLSPELCWEDASGDATLVSWVVYHRAFHPAFAHRLPYTVAIVELAEGVRMISNIVGDVDPESLRIEQPLRLRIEQEEDFAIPRFVPA
jgi:uncharacterized OB-fold protein